MKKLFDWLVLRVGSVAGAIGILLVLVAVLYFVIKWLLSNYSTAQQQINANNELLQSKIDDAQEILDGKFGANSADTVSQLKASIADYKSRQTGSFKFINWLFSLFTPK